jgi:hypothetical protein
MAPGRLPPFLQSLQELAAQHAERELIWKLTICADTLACFGEGLCKSI